jgi:hypothetical protein
VARREGREAELPVDHDVRENLEGYYHLFDWDEYDGSYTDWSGGTDGALVRCQEGLVYWGGKSLLTKEGREYILGFKRRYRTATRISLAPTTSIWDGHGEDEWEYQREQDDDRENKGREDQGREDEGREDKEGRWVPSRSTTSFKPTSEQAWYRDDDGADFVCATIPVSESWL